ncbi:patatin-like phospholipase family protein [Aestuariibacter sp. AA17]|uniref:Patatin-like phospholipase family protein n=1 Tax=Fluctibacter corallii TaxID=2984329 RepID=A0ABT3ABD2_9ALTE|nr:patatin-like phospholipase family protein [Aestuariibacter sp. AA17]MCV2885924.1 patatin-like phospholipase family protein [Aestuariibacter sp. AA17]
MSKLILSLDGGGIRGAATTQFLVHVENTLEEKYGLSIRDCVDFYAGTSTGSIIALGLATTSLTMQQINELYNDDNAKQIFSPTEGIFEIDGLNAPKYQAEGKTRLLAQHMGKATLGDTPKDKHVLAVSYGVESRKPQIIKTTNDNHKSLLACEVADASSAAPTFFPTKEMALNGVEEEFWLIDGAVVANNPTMCAIAEAKHAWGDIPVDDMRVISIGTGYRTRKINGLASQKWGGLQWITKGHLVDILTDERVVAYQAGTICKKGSYIRVNAEMRIQPGLPYPPDDAMDDVSTSNIKRLKSMGDFWFSRYGDAVVDMMAAKYTGDSLDRIDANTGNPRPIVAP